MGHSIIGESLMSLLCASIHQAQIVCKLNWSTRALGAAAQVDPLVQVLNKELAGQFFLHNTFRHCGYNLVLIMTSTQISQRVKDSLSDGWTWQRVDPACEVRAMHYHKIIASSVLSCQAYVHDTHIV